MTCILMYKSLSVPDEMNLPADIPSYLSSQGTLSEPQEGYSNSENGSHQQLMPSHANGYVHKGTDGNVTLCSSSEKVYFFRTAVNLTTCVVSTCHYDRCIILLCWDVFQQEYVTVKWAVMLIQMLMECWVVVWALSLLDVAASTGVNPERDRQISLMVILNFKFVPKIHMIWFA